jgi:transcriptional regulator with XRE-family HTH domain
MWPIRVIATRRGNSDRFDCLTHVRHSGQYEPMSEISRRAHDRIPDLTLGWRLKMALGDMASQDMAKVLEVSRTTVSRWMGDRGTPPHTLFVRQWALITGTDPAWLLTGQQTAPQPAGPVEGLDECAVRELNPQPAD